MAGDWTPERREKAKINAYRHQPWNKSTGPKTAKGKERSSKNAMKHGLRSDVAGLLKRLCMDYEEFRRLVGDWCQIRESDENTERWCPCERPLCLSPTTLKWAGALAPPTRGVWGESSKNCSKCSRSLNIPHDHWDLWAEQWVEHWFVLFRHQVMSTGGWWTIFC